MMHKKTANRDQQHGFALLLSLFLMSFVLVILLTIVTLVQVETTTSAHSLSQLRAREAARLALMQAIGQLQKVAGPDQRVTARADILGDGNYAPEAKYWTGVWDTGNPTEGPVWLVSGEAPNPNQMATSITLLVGEASTTSDSSQHVFGPTVTIENSSGALHQGFAWWVSDEGVKASMGIIPLNLRNTLNFLSNESTKSLSLALTTTLGLEELFTNYDQFTSVEANHFSKISSIEQLFDQPNFADDNSWRLSSETPYHSLTLWSKGVLASVVPGNSGGLMRDLSLFPALLGANFETYLNYGVENAKAQNLPDADLNRKRLYMDIVGLDDLGTLSTGDIATPIAPILSNSMIAFTIRNESTNDPSLYLRLRCFFEFWNPYTHTLRMTENGKDLRLELDITGLPTVTVQKGSVTVPVDMQAVLGNDPSDATSPMTIRLINNSNEEWLPGYSKNWTGVDAGTVPANGHSPYQSVVTDSKQWNRNDRTLGFNVGIDTGVDLNVLTDDDITLHFNNTTQLIVKVHLSNGATRKLIGELDGIRYETDNTTARTPTNRSTNFGYHWILRGPHQSRDDANFNRGLWLKDYDLRNPTPKFYNDWSLDYDPTTDSGSPYLPINDGIMPLTIVSPVQLNEVNGTIETSSLRRLLDRSAGPYGSNFDKKLWQDTPVFEIPRERVLSLASLQHLYFHNERPFQVGNSWGREGTINTLSWFDQYYFSGFDRSDEINDFVPAFDLPNPVLSLYNDSEFVSSFKDWLSANKGNETASKEPSEHFMVDGRFNLNSTSVAAWKAVLGSLRLNDFEYLNYPEEDTSDLSSLTISKDSRGATFTRYSQSLEETYEAPKGPLIAGNETVAPSAFYRLGARRLDSSEIESLATEVVTLIQSQNMPFLSVEKFLSVLPGHDQSLLEMAIESVFADNGRQKWAHDWEVSGTKKDGSEEIVDVDHFSPGFLTQADVMAAIGPILSPRSDTFKIRAKGFAYDLKGERIASATIEATAQRIPITSEYQAPYLAGESRQIKITSVRWIPDNEI